MIYYVNNNPIDIPTTKKCLNSGSEGKIYRIDNKIYKIYYTNTISNMTQTTITCHKTMTTIKTKQIILPTDLIYNAKGECCGYVNDPIPGDPNNKTGITKIASNKFIRNLEILQEDSTILGENLILMRDVNEDNYHYDSNTETMYILDSSRYTRKVNLEVEDYIRKNSNSLNALIEELLILDFKKFKPIKTILPKRTAIRIVDRIKEKKQDLSYSEFFKSELQGYESVHEYAKSFTKNK